MDRRSHVLAVLAAGGEGASFTPVQVQKIFFLVDKKAAHLLEGRPYFNFQPYDYGPFDAAVYDQLSELANERAVHVESTGRYKCFSLTQSGYQQGLNNLGQLGPAIQRFLVKTVAWVKGLRFDQLVAAIYREYPEMKEKSIFRQ